MERGSRKNPHCLRRSRVVRILGFRANILAELSEALNFWFFWFKPKEQNNKNNSYNNKFRHNEKINFFGIIAVRSDSECTSRD